MLIGSAFSFSNSADSDTEDCADGPEETAAQGGDNGPLANYLRFPCSAFGSSFTEGDEVTCAALHELVLIVGTQQGFVLAWWHEAQASRQLRKHEGRVLDVAVDAAGAFVASSSADCSVAVGPLGAGAREGAARAPGAWLCTYPRPMLSVALCPEYASGAVGSQAVCVGGEECKLVLSHRGTFEPRHVTLHSGEGPVSSVRWRGTLIAWANAKGVKVLDVETYQKVTHIPQPPCADSDVGGELWRCCLSWSTDDVLLIAWGSVVVIAVVRQKLGGPAGVCFASIACSFRLPVGVVCGLAAFDSKHLSLVTTEGSSSCDSGEAIPRTAHRICTWAGRVLSSEALPLGGRACSPSVASAEGGALPCVFAGGDAIAIRRRTVADHISWLIEQRQFEVAVGLVSSTGLEHATERREMLALCVAPLLTSGEPARAAGLVQQLCAASGEAWSVCINLFDQAGELPRLVPEIPAPPQGSRLPVGTYDALLQRLAAVSPRHLCSTLDSWPSDIYSAPPLMECLRSALPSSITGAGMEVSADEHDTNGCSQPAAERCLLVEALSRLHEAAGDYATAAKLLARVGSDRLFPFLSRHLPSGEGPHGAPGSSSLEALRKIISNDFGQLFDICPGEALELAVAHTSTFRPHMVLEAVAPCGRFWQHRYLRLLLHQEPEAAQEFRALYMSLAAEFEPHNFHSLLQKLVSSEGGEDGNGSGDGLADEAGGDIDTYLEAFRSHGVVDAEVMLLERQRRFKDAVRLLLYELGDAAGALRLIEAAPADQAAELYEELLEAACKDARLCSLLLTLSSAASEPLLLPCKVQAGLIRRMPPGLEVPRLAAKLASALDDAESERDLQLLYLRRLQSETASLSQKIFKQQRRGVAVVPAGREHVKAPQEAQQEVRRPAFRIPWQRRALALL